MRQFTIEHKQKLSEGRRQYRQREDDLWVRTYKIILPNGDTILTPNLKKYCLANSLSYESMKKISYGKFKYHKGHTCEIIASKTCKIPCLSPADDIADLWRILHHIVFNQNKSRQFI